MLLCICENRVQPVYVGRNRVLDLSGGQSVGRSDQLFSLADEMQEHAGTRHPMSVFNAFGCTYFFDSFRGKWWRYRNGLYAITEYGMSRYFRNAAIAFGVDSPQEHWFIGGYDPRMKMPLVKVWQESGDGIYPEMWGFREEGGSGLHRAVRLHAGDHGDMWPTADGLQQGQDLAPRQQRCSVFILRNTVHAKLHGACKRHAQ